MEQVKNQWVIIKSCQKSSWWYNDKIGEILRVNQNLFPPNYNLAYNKKNGPYPLIHHEDVEVITPTLIQKFKTYIKERI